jgi:predicted LPLAT superfamily acyltransferase
LDALVIIVAFFFGLLMCLGLILMKWIIAQLGATLFFLVLFLAVAMFLLAMGDEKHDDE